MATLLDDEENLTEEERLQRELAALQAQIAAVPPATKEELQALNNQIPDPEPASSPYDSARYSIPDAPMMGEPPSTPQPGVKLPDGSVGTVRSIGVGDERGEWVIPTIVDGKPVSEDEAVNLWRTGKNKAIGGPFKSIEEGNAFGQKFHEAEARRLGLSPSDSTPQFPEGQRFSDPNNADTGKFTTLGSYSAADAAAMADRNAGYDAQSLVQIKRMQGQAEFDRLVKSGVAPETAYRQTAGLLNFSDPKALAQGLHEVPAPRPSGPLIPESLKAVPVVDPLSGKQIGHSIYDLTGKNHGFRSLQEEQASTVGEREVLKRRLSSAAKAEDEARKNLSFDVDGTAKAAYEDAKKARAQAEKDLEGGYSKSSAPSLPPSVKLSKPASKVYFGSKDGEPQDKPAAAPANEITARNPKTGEVLVYRNGKWVKP